MWIRSVRLLSGICVAASLACAGPITFAITGTGSGTYGSTPFTSQIFTLTATTDTTLVNCDGSGDCTTPVLSGISISVGAQSGTATDTFTVFDNHPISDVGFQDDTTDNIVAETGAAFSATYQLNGNVPPTGGTTSVALNAPFNTSFGTLEFTSAGNMSFSANLGASVPEPATVSAMGIGILALIAWHRRLARPQR
jgi:PEP-CTERM motif